jgi:copper chaperone CopZ
MSIDVSGDQFVLIRIEGMHCHRCEQAIKKSVGRHPGVHEVEVDFNSRQASVLFDAGQVSIEQLMDSVREAGYHATGFTQGLANTNFGSESKESETTRTADPSRA